MRRTAFLLALFATPAAAQPLGGEQPLLRELAAQVSPERQRATIERLVGFGTRHAGSDTKSDKRGIGGARRWIASEFNSISKDCPRLTVETPSQVMTAERLAGPTEIQDVIAVLPGTSDPGRVIVISGHYDSRNTDAKDFKGDAPGANDDGSGIAAVIEAARVLCKQRFAATLVFAALAGEEEGLLGGKVLADYAVQKGWRVEADLNNDIVGNTDGLSGVRDNTHVRIFSEGTRATETPEQADRRRYNGGEVDSPSRNLARFMDRLADRYLTNLDVVMVYRTDRFGRGGDQNEFLKAGFPAVRVTEAVENYTRQHQDLRTDKGVKYGDTIDGVDFANLAQVTRLNAVTMAALASAPKPPVGVEI
jgi:Zn-dependent M28 family amino/carboxypeptidase